jgi:competence protein ComEC
VSAPGGSAFPGVAAAHALHRPVICLLPALMAGILLGDWLPGVRLGVWLAATGCALATAAAMVRCRTALAAPLLLFVCLGYLSLQPWADPQLPAHHLLHYAGSQKWRIVGRIQGPARETAHRLRLTLEVAHLAAGQRQIPVCGRLRTTVMGQGPVPHEGDLIALEGRIKPIHNFDNPGGFDYERYMRFQGIWASTWTRAEDVTLLRRGSPTPYRHWIEGLRRSALALIDETLSDAADDSSRAVLKALLVGHRDDITTELRDRFNRAGVGHLLAISGLHVGAVAGAFYFVLVRLLARCNFLLWRAWVRRGAALVTLLPVLVYGQLAGMPPSTQRAVIMTLVLVLAFLAGRRGDLVNTLAVAAMAILIDSPVALFNISFQLSFAAVLAIALGLPATIGRLSPAKTSLGRLGRWALNLTAVSLLAIAGTLPLVARYFNQVSLVAPLANLLIVPLVGMLCVPAGLLAIFCLPICPPLAGGLMALAAALLRPAMAIITAMAQWPWAAVLTVTPSILEMGLFYSLVLLLLRGFRGRTAKVLLIGLLAVSLLDVAYWIDCRFGHQQVRLTALDVGQGSAALLELPGGFTMLVDGGGFSDNAVFDVGRQIVAPLLWRRKIRTVNLLVLTHPNADHLNGLIYIARHFHVQTLWTNGDGAQSEAYRNLSAIVDKDAIARPSLADMRRGWIINSVSVRALYPPDDYLQRRPVEPWRDENASSLVIRVAYGNWSALFTGDITAHSEADLLVRQPVQRLHSTVLLAPHHGSKSSSSQAFVDAVAPRMVIISAGWRNPYGFPDSAVTARYRRQGARVLRTDRHGAVTLVTDGRTLSVTSQR